MDRKVKAGLLGSIVLAVCCFTPVLVWLFGLIGLTAYLGWLDVVLLPGLVFFLGFTGYALWQKRRSTR